MNDVSEKFLNLQQELLPYKQIMSQACEIIINENVSKYPIMVVHQQELNMGVTLLEAGEQYKWSIQASTLEEFTTKQIIFEENVPAFIQTYKDPEHYICLFILSELGANFIFLPK
ncbi:MAG: hypothetical protein H6567_02165 [Lewinellaceae bacterium]|nr:hypothetical protein [Lewinellaceae bacterium]